MGDDDDDLNDDILQLLSRPSSANASNKRKPRKKVSFSKSILQVTDNRYNTTEGIASSLSTSTATGTTTSARYKKSPPIPSHALPNNGSKEDNSDAVVDNNHDGGDNLQSFSRSKRVVDQSYSHNVDDINDLFQIQNKK